MGRPTIVAAYAISECEPLSSHSLRSSCGVMSSTKLAPAPSHWGRPALKSPAMTHSVNGSVATAAGSSTPVSSTIACMASSEIDGVMRSIIVVAKPTFSSTHAASDGSTRAATSLTTWATISPLSGTLSHGQNVIGPAPASRRTIRPAANLPGAVFTSARFPALIASRSACTAGLSASRPPPGLGM